ncbi:MAG TPA: redoxin family protein [Polyangiaceae bacterium]|nr:redoxin family protein [Polyangiaceae bacterium]
MDLKRLALTALLATACAPARAPNSISGQLQGADGAFHPILNPLARFTVIEFFSAHCPCQAVHDARLKALAERYRASGVYFIAVDSEAGASIARDGAEAVRRGYSYPLLIDPDGALARSTQADYATYSLLVDTSGRVMYRGGIDSDRSHLRDDATPYLQNAIEDALAGRSLRNPEAKTLGCSLMLR